MIVQMPLFYLIDTFGNLLRAWACFDRIQAYLQISEWEDPRKFRAAITDSGNDAEKKAEKQTRQQCSDMPTNVVFELGDAWISPPGSPRSILKNINLQVQRSRVVALLGPIACGKSTFLRALLGEANLLRGTLRVCKEGTTVAFCDQTPWLHNGTLRDNVLGPKLYDEKWYRTVTERCQLLADFAQLRNGDQTMVGSDGMNLSVGQRHRVCVARAVYTLADVIVVDDIFSSQDQVTARAIVKELLGAGGLLRQSKTTVILATHLSAVVDVCDEALFFDGEGNVTRSTVFDRAELKKELVTAMDVAKQTSTALPDLDRETEHARDTHTGNGTAAVTAEHASSSNIRTRGDFGLYRFYFRALKNPQFFLWIATMVVVTICDNFPSKYLFPVRICRQIKS